MDSTRIDPIERAPTEEASIASAAVKVESVLLISPYEIGRQPFGLAQPAAWLVDSGIDVRLNDLAVEDLNEEAVANATTIGLYLAMHTATRLGLLVIDRIRVINPEARLFAFGLYAPMNESILHEYGVDTIFGGEAEPAIRSFVVHGVGAGAVTTSVARIAYKLPRRELLPTLDKYAHLMLAGGETRTVAFAETTRGCKHLCRHCPVVPVYEGRFVAVPVDTVIADIAQQVAAGATHVSFGDPDFLNGPTHALRVLERMHAEFPALSFDATVKVEHILKHPDVIQRMGELNCLFLTSAFESFDDAVLDRLAKGHRLSDVANALSITRRAGIAIEPTFIPFTPWTTLESYRDLLRHIVEFDLVDAVAPVQLVIRLLVPNGSKLLDIEGFEALLLGFDADALGYPWQHQDPRVDALQEQVMAFVDDPSREKQSKREVFAGLWTLAHAALGEPAPVLNFVSAAGDMTPTLSEDWYCCAEPSCAQLAPMSFAAAEASGDGGHANAAKLAAGE